MLAVRGSVAQYSGIAALTSGGGINYIEQQVRRLGEPDAPGAQAQLARQVRQARLVCQMRRVRQTRHVRRESRVCATARTGTGSEHAHAAANTSTFIRPLSASLVSLFSWPPSPASAVAAVMLTKELPHSLQPIEENGV